MSRTRYQQRQAKRRRERRNELAWQRCYICARPCYSLDDRACASCREQLDIAEKPVNPYRNNYLKQAKAFRRLEEAAGAAPEIHRIELEHLNLLAALEAAADESEVNLEAFRFAEAGYHAWLESVTP